MDEALDAPLPSQRIPVAPPTAPRPLPPRPSPWPMAVGTICIVFGALGGLSNAAGLVGVAVQASMKSLADHNPILHASDRYVPWMIAQAVIAVFLSIFLLVGGIGLVRRAAWSRRTLVTWSIAKALFVPGATVLAFLMQTAQMTAMAKVSATSSRGAAMPFSGAALDGFIAAMMLVSLAWGLALPVFLLIWFFRARIRTEVGLWK